MPTTKLTKSVIEAATPEERRYVLWDSQVLGLGCRVAASGRKSFILSYRTEDGTKRQPVIGVFGSITLQQARALAQDMLAEVRGGGDPSASRKRARSSPTVADVCDRFLKEHSKLHKKPSSYRNDKLNIRLHIKPRLGQKKIGAVTYDDVAKLHQDMRSTPYAANRVVALLSKLMNLAEQWQLRPQGTNPCRHIKRFKEQRKHRDLTQAETARLAKILREAEGDDPEVSENPRVVAAIRLLMFSGCRRNEVLGLRWDEVDLERGLLHLSDSKTGAKVVHLNSAAVEVIEFQEPVEDNPYVFPGRRDGRPLTDIKRPWERIRARAKLDGVRLHDLRHNYASAAAGGGLSLPMIGKLLGHKSPATTARYADLADDPAKRAAEQVGLALTKAMNGDEQGRSER